MYAIVETGGKQYRVEEGSRVRVEMLDSAVGEEVVFDRVLAVKDEDSFKAGNPYLAEAKVVGSVTDIGKDKKIIVFKYKAKKNYRRKQGHRQPYTDVCIKRIEIV